MNHCKIIEDLLPLYIDGLTNEESTEYVRRHLEKCPACAQAHRQMRSPALEPEEMAIPDYQKAIRRSTLTIVLQSVCGCILALLLCLYLLWETGFLFAPEKIMASADGGRQFVVRYYDEAGFFGRCGAYILTPDGQGRDHRGDETFVDAHAYWAPNSTCYFIHYEFTDHDETFYWGYDAPPTPQYDENGDLTGYRSGYSDRIFPQDGDLYGYIETLCREHPALAQGWTGIQFQFERWSEDSESICFSFSTDAGESGSLWYSILTNSIEGIEG